MHPIVPPELLDQCHVVCEQAEAIFDQHKNGRFTDHFCYVNDDRTDLLVFIAWSNSQHKDPDLACEEWFHWAKYSVEDLLKSHPQYAIAWARKLKRFAAFLEDQANQTRLLKEPGQ